MKKTRTKSHAVIILDKSGSMGPYRDVTIRGFNEQIQTLKESAKNKDISVSMYTFSNNVDTLFSGKNATDVEEITEKDYQPNGMTALLDAVSQAIDDVKAKAAKDDDVLFVIMSDGEENASHKTNWNTLAEKIQERQGTNKWTFTYMGACQDLSQISKKLSIPMGNIAGFQADSLQGHTHAHGMMAKGISAHYSRDIVASASASDCFYSSIVDDKKDEDKK